MNHLWKKDSQAEMFIQFAVSLLLLYTASATSFTYNGFSNSNLTLDGAAEITSDGLLKLTNTTVQLKGHAFYPHPISFKESPNGNASSFSTTFVFGIVTWPTHSGQGFGFLISETTDFSSAIPSQFLGMFSNNRSNNSVVAVEFDTIQNKEYLDVDNNHVGIDINSLQSVVSYPAEYYDDSSGKFINLTLNDGKPMQAWVEYDGVHLNVTLGPADVGKPKIPLLSLKQDLSRFFKNTMYVGFSSATGTNPVSHYITGWSFKIEGDADPLSNLPNLPRFGGKKTSKLLTIALPAVLVVAFAFSLLAVAFRKRWTFNEVNEPWEREYGPHRFQYKDLNVATRGFSSGNLLGCGGFGKVYKGTLKASDMEIAVKRLTHNSSLEMKQFVAEIVSMGGLSHRNLVKLHGYCRRKAELLLVYDFMPNGSLDKYLGNEENMILTWRQRFDIIKDVASGLSYLHGDFSMAVIHRDIKPSNVLLDEDMRGKIGDFGLAKLHDHGDNLQSTVVIGTRGYIAPEYQETGIATTATDVFAFGVFLLEVGCGRRPIEVCNKAITFNLERWVRGFWLMGEILQARDPKLGSDFVAEEVEMVLKLGMMCQSREVDNRPSMKEIVHYLSGNAAEASHLMIPDSPLHPDYPLAELYTSTILASELSGGR